MQLLPSEKRTVKSVAYIYNQNLSGGIQENWDSRGLPVSHHHRKLHFDNGEDLQASTPLSSVHQDQVGACVRPTTDCHCTSHCSGSLIRMTTWYLVEKLIHHLKMLPWWGVVKASATTPLFEGHGVWVALLVSWRNGDQTHCQKCRPSRPNMSTMLGPPWFRPSKDRRHICSLNPENSFA